MDSNSCVDETKISSEVARGNYDCCADTTESNCNCMRQLLITVWIVHVSSNH